MLSNFGIVTGDARDLPYSSGDQTGNIEYLLGLSSVFSVVEIEYILEISTTCFIP